jgi:hypothetical protein
MLPIYESQNYEQTIMLCGGSKLSTKEASDMCWKITPEPGSATTSNAWTQVASMPHGRLMPDGVLLPDGTILATNGAAWGQAGGNAGQAQYAAGAVLDTDLYDPKTDTWKTIGKSTVARLYHSGALLLSDATVVTVGSEMANYLDVWGTNDKLGEPLTTPFAQTFAKAECWPKTETACTDPYEYRVEHFTPSYITSGAARPVIIQAPEKATYNSTIGISVDPSVKVKRVTFIRYTSTTHSLNTDQRFIEPTILFNNGSFVVVRVPPNGNIAPPGNWYVFALGEGDVPSVAKTVLFGRGEVTEVNVKLDPVAGSSGGKSGAALGVSGSAWGSFVGSVVIAMGLSWVWGFGM